MASAPRSISARHWEVNRVWGGGGCDMMSVMVSVPKSPMIAAAAVTEAIGAELGDRSDLPYTVVRESWTATRVAPGDSSMRREMAAGCCGRFRRAGAGGGIPM